MTSECEHVGGSWADIMHDIMLSKVMYDFQGRPMAGSVQLWTGELRSHLAICSHVPSRSLVIHLTLHVMYQLWRDRLLDWTHLVAWGPVLLHPL